MRLVRCAFRLPPRSFPAVHAGFRFTGFTGGVGLLLLAPSTSRTSARRFVAGVVGVVLLLRLGYVAAAPYSDEAGYLLVARDWHAGGPHLYGHYFVDRPPLLLALYRLASLTGGIPAIRVVAATGAALLVVCAAWAAQEAVGSRGARWAALVAAAFAVTPLLAAQEADGELLAAPLVMASVALTVAAVRRRGRASFGCAVLAGVTAASAVMVKQNFVDGVVFAATLLVVSRVQRRIATSGALRVAGGGVLGGLLVLGGATAYVAWSRVSLSSAFAAVFGFRGTALDVIEDHSLAAPLHRALDLVWLGLVSGVLVLLLVLLLDAARCRFRGPPVAWAVAVTLLLDGVSVAAGAATGRTTCCSSGRLSPSPLGSGRGTRCGCGWSPPSPRPRRSSPRSWWRRVGCPRRARGCRSGPFFGAPARPVTPRRCCSGRPRCSWPRG